MQIRYIIEKLYSGGSMFESWLGGKNSADIFLVVFLSLRANPNAVT
jgi:hypothetical protein